MDDKVIDKIAILAKLSAISDIQLKLQQDRNQLEEELREILLKLNEIQPQLKKFDL